MRTRKPPDPESRKLVGYFQVPPDGASPKAERAWMNNILDAMEQVEKEETPDKRQQAKKSSKKKR